MRICNNCGTELNPGVSFCPQCGKACEVNISGHYSQQRSIKQENVGLTVGLASAFSIMIVGILIVLIFVLGGNENYYIKSGNVSADGSGELGTADEKENVKVVSGEIAFTAATYEVEVNKDIDMTKYLNCNGVDVGDISWFSDSDKMYVGSDGHVSVHDNGALCDLTASAKGNESIQTKCQLKTRTPGEDLAYQVESINNGKSEDEEIENGVVRVAVDTEGVQMVDLSVQKYEPAEHKDDYKWDKTLFYTLEDVDLNSNSDGKINSYVLEKKQFINKETDNRTEYEIYHNPDSDVINKIVSIEYLDKKLAIMEFYYTDDGKVNFIYSYEDVNYTPSYATPNRDGERFRFDHDTLVTWRIVENGEIMNYCSGSKEYEKVEKSYKNRVKNIADCPADIQSQFDESEKRMLNLAYIIMDKIVADEGISTISGYVYDYHDEEVEDAAVKLVSIDYNCDLYTTETDENGYYEIQIPTRDLEYSLYIEKPDHIEETICDVDADLDEINLAQEIIYLSPEDNNEYTCYFQFYDALNKDEEGFGMAVLEGVDVEVRRGVNNRDGDIVKSAHMNESYGEMMLKPGMYTVHITKTDYLDCYNSLFVSAETGNYLEVYATPALNDDEIRIVLTWGDDPNDLDSHLFTPSSSGLEEDYHICYYNMGDTGGNNSLDVDDTDGYGPETTTINHIQNGLYKFYVCDYTDCSGGNEESQRMSDSGAVVRVYGSQGLIQAFNVPVKRNGVIWEVFEIRDGKLIPNQRYYDSIGDKTWWQSTKW